MSSSDWTVVISREGGGIKTSVTCKSPEFINDEQVVFCQVRDDPWVLIEFATSLGGWWGALIAVVALGVLVFGREALTNNETRHREEAFTYLVIHGWIAALITMGALSGLWAFLKAP